MLSINSGIIKTFRKNYDMLQNPLHTGKRSRSGVTVRCSSFAASGKTKEQALLTFQKTILLPEVPQLVRAEKITKKLFSRLKGKLAKANSKIQETLNEINCTTVMISYLRCLDKFKILQLTEVKSLYPIIQDPNFLLYAYSMIKNRPIAVGLDQVPISNITLGSIVKLASELKTHKYKPKPIRRIMIPKAKGGLRPLGISNSKDKVVQQAIYMVLNPFYDPFFSRYSHGFRSNKSTHTCLHQMKML